MADKTLAEHSIKVGTVEIRVRLAHHVVTREVQGKEKKREATLFEHYVNGHLVAGEHVRTLLDMARLELLAGSPSAVKAASIDDKSPPKKGQKR